MSWRRALWERQHELALQVTSAGVGDRADGGTRTTVADKGPLVIERFRGDDGLCCPTRIERQAYYLSGDKLVAEGPPSQKVYMAIDEGNDEPKTEVPAWDDSGRD
jgi:hypothetical protein